MVCYPVIYRIGKERRLRLACSVLPEPSLVVHMKKGPIDKGLANS